MLTSQLDHIVSIISLAQLNCLVIVFIVQGSPHYLCWSDSIICGIFSGITTFSICFLYIRSSINISYDNNHALQLCSNLVEKAGKKKGGEKRGKERMWRKSTFFWWVSRIIKQLSHPILKTFPLFFSPPFHTWSAPNLPGFQLLCQILPNQSYSIMSMFKKIPSKIQSEKWTKLWRQSKGETFWKIQQTHPSSPGLLKFFSRKMTILGEGG